MLRRKVNIYLVDSIFAQCSVTYPNENTVTKCNFFFLSLISPAKCALLLMIMVVSAQSFELLVRSYMQLKKIDEKQD